MDEPFWDGKFEWQEPMPNRIGMVLDFINRYTSQFVGLDVPNEIDMPETLLVPLDGARRIGLTEDSRYDLDIDEEVLDEVLSKAINPNCN